MPTSSTPSRRLTRTRRLGSSTTRLPSTPRTTGWCSGTAPSHRSTKVTKTPPPSLRSSTFAILHLDPVVRVGVIIWARCRPTIRKAALLCTLMRMRSCVWRLELTLLLQFGCMLTATWLWLPLLPLRPPSPARLANSADETYFPSRNVYGFQPTIRRHVVETRRQGSIDTACSSPKVTGTASSPSLRSSISATSDSYGQNGNFNHNLAELTLLLHSCTCRLQKKYKLISGWYSDEVCDH